MNETKAGARAKPTKEAVTAWTASAELCLPAPQPPKEWLPATEQLPSHHEVENKEWKPALSFAQRNAPGIAILGGHINTALSQKGPSQVVMEEGCEYFPVGAFQPLTEHATQEGQRNREGRKITWGQI